MVHIYIFKKAKKAESRRMCGVSLLNSRHKWVTRFLSLYGNHKIQEIREQ